MLNTNINIRNTFKIIPLNENSAHLKLEHEEPKI